MGGGGGAFAELDMNSLAISVGLLPLYGMVFATVCAVFETMSGWSGWSGFHALSGFHGASQCTVFLAE